MPSAARGSVTASNVRWLQTDSGTWHAYTWMWNGHGDDSKVRTMPVCGRPLPRRKLGRGSAPPCGDEVCQACAVEVGFRRRPLTSSAMRRKYGRGRIENMAIDTRVGLLEREVVELRKALASLVAADDVPAEG